MQGRLIVTELRRRTMVDHETDLGNAGQPTKLAKAPSVHGKRPVVPGGQHQPTRIGGIGLDQSRRNPAVDTRLLLPPAMFGQCRKRLKTLVLMIWWW